jgi:hypothetical protein
MGLWPIQGYEKHRGPATTLYATVALSFVIPSEAEGSAVLSTTHQSSPVRPIKPRPIQHGNNLIPANSELQPRLQQILGAHSIAITKRRITEPPHIKRSYHPQNLIRKSPRIINPMQPVRSFKQSPRRRPKVRMLTQKKSRS